MEKENRKTTQDAIDDRIEQLKKGADYYQFRTDKPQYFGKEKHIKLFKTKDNPNKKAVTLRFDDSGLSDSPIQSSVIDKSFITAIVMDKLEPVVWEGDISNLPTDAVDLKKANTVLKGQNTKAANALSDAEEEIAELKKQLEEATAPPVDEDAPNA